MGWFGRRGEEDGDEAGTSAATSELDEVRQTVITARMPEEVERIALKEWERLAKTSPSSAEYTIGLNYLEYLVSLPWNAMTRDNLDIEHAKAILDEAHYGLDDIKERILEYLAVRRLKLTAGYRILVVDDDAIACRNLGHVLLKDGYDVETVASGQEALDRLGEHHFDVVITDLKMQTVGGLEVLKGAQQIDPSIEVIMISGVAAPPKAVEIIAKGAFHFLAKPLDLDELRTLIKKALHAKEKQYDSKGPTLCLVGPPGTGKTSLQRSIARCLGKKFIRISLAGMKDEAEIRGHRRSYVGALPGRIIQEIRRAGSRNPLVMLDEIDKIGQDFKGDPASALLEVLDPSQNSHFNDHYLDLPFDLSKCMFIATANTLDPIPPPLLDRMELLFLSGYTEEEKEQIAFKFLIPKEVNEAGLTRQPPQFSPAAVQTIIREYTREAGVRNLQRQIASICRKTARMVAAPLRNESPPIITPETVEALLGPRRYFFEVTGTEERVGVATGLALTESGGQIMFIEATIMKGKEQLLLTGSLGEVMKESAQAALSYLRSNAGRYRIAEDFFAGHDIHIHIPAGAISKDGPSAGITIAVALVSLLTGRPVRRDVALTGELTLSGRILPVGGIKGKILAARRAGIKKVVLPAMNASDLKAIAEHITRDLEIVLASEMEEIVEAALLPHDRREN